MNIKFEEIKPLVEEASIIGNRVICKFKDKNTGQVVLSAADVPKETGERKPLPLMQRLLKFLNTGSTAMKERKQQAILQAFHKVYNQFELQNGKWRLKQVYQVKDVWRS